MQCTNLACRKLFLSLAAERFKILGRCTLLIVSFRSRNFAQRAALAFTNRINQHFGSVNILGLSKGILEYVILTIGKWKFDSIQRNDFIIQTVISKSS